MKRYKPQALIFDKNGYSKRKVSSWIIKNNYKVPKYKKEPIRKYEKTIRVRLREPKAFNKNTLRRKTIDKGVILVYGRLRK